MLCLYTTMRARRMNKPILNTYSDYYDQYWFDDYDTPECDNDQDGFYEYDTNTDSQPEFDYDECLDPDELNRVIQEREESLDKMIQMIRNVRNQAATRIQCHMRGYYARQEYRFPNPYTEIGQRRLLSIFQAT